MQHHNTSVDTAPHPVVVNRALTNINQRLQQNPTDSTRMSYDMYGRCVVLVGQSPADNADNASTALSFYNNVFNPDQGEVYRVSMHESHESLERLHRADTRLKGYPILDFARKTLDQFKDEVVAWRPRLAEHHINGLVRRLEYILEDEPEMGSTRIAPSLDSFSVLLAYLARHPEFKTPSIGYNRDGTFSAVWTGDKKLRVTLDSISPTSIRWIFVDSRRGIKDSITGAGIVSLEILTGVIDAYEATNWMKA